MGTVELYYCCGEIITSKGHLKVFRWPLNLNLSYININTIFILINPIPQSAFDMKSIATAGAYAAITLGIFGMFFCLPFLFSASIPDLIGAGFPFVGAAIIASAGLISLTRLAIDSKREKDQL